MKESGSDAPAAAEDAALKQRLSELSGRLAQAEANAVGKKNRVEEARRKGDKALAGAMGQGVRVMGEFVAAIVVSALLGWQFDKWFGTSPVALLIMLVLGACAGFWGVYKMAAQQGKASQ